jgi:hypothetical protein
MTSGTGEADTIDDGDTEADDDGDDESPTEADDDDDDDDDADDDAGDAPSDDDAGSTDGEGDTTSLPLEESSSDASAEDDSTGTAEESTDDAGESSSDSGEPGVVDLSGFILVQTDSAREITIPDDTIVPVGGALVIGRNATLGEFEDFWGVTLGDDVVYIDGVDVFPACNGDETFSLMTPLRTVVDGPTPALTISTLLERTDASAPADDEGAWVSSALPNTDGTPGTGIAAGGDTGVPFISEIVDATGAGNFSYEFVEIRIAS